MARRATKDTYAFEPVGVVPGDDTVVRREIKAGWDIPDHYQLENEGDAEEYGGMVAGLGAAPHAYKHQLDEHGQVSEEHAPDTEDDEDESGNKVHRRTAARGRRPAAAASESKSESKSGS